MSFGIITGAIGGFILGGVIGLPIGIAVAAHGNNGDKSGAKMFFEFISVTFISSLIGAASIISYEISDPPEMIFVFDTNSNRQLIE